MSIYYDIGVHRAMFAAGLVKTAADGVTKKSTMLALYPDPAFEEKIKPHAQDELKDKLHVTVVYMGELDDAELDIVKRITSTIVKRHSPLKLSVNGSGVFYNNDAAVRQLLINGPGLNEFRADLFNSLNDAGIMPEQKYGYIPHMTLEYHKDHQMPENWELVGKGKYPAWTAGKLSLVQGDNVLEEYAFGAKYEKEARAASGLDAAIALGGSIGALPGLMQEGDAVDSLPLTIGGAALGALGGAGAHRAVEAGLPALRKALGRTSKTAPIPSAPPGNSFNEVMAQLFPAKRTRYVVPSEDLTPEGVPLEDVFVLGEG